MNGFIVPETGEYQLWAYDPACREIRVMADGDLINVESSNLPDAELNIDIVVELAEGTVITTEPGNAPFVARTSDETVVYDTTGKPG